MGKELFNNIPSKVGELLMQVRIGSVGLPDLQRPFVWTDAKVRDLLDSMMKGYPIGYIMLWSTPQSYENAKQIGDNDKSHKIPSELVIDGQQRLTALLAAMCGIIIRDKSYKERKIKIAFNPQTREFAVWSMAYERDAEWISCISDAFEADENHDSSKFRKAYIRKANEGREKNGKESLTDDEEDIIEQNLKDLLDLKIYLLPTLKIEAGADEQDVADIFVRVNSGGQKLTEKNFIGTLLAVYDNGVHDRINRFCAESRIPADKTSYNPLIELDPAHIIRMTVGVGFRRARLKYAYMLLRGKNLNTGEISQDEQSKNLSIFKNSLDTVLDLNNWHSFLNIYMQAGYLKSTIISSTNTIVFSYVLYLLGKYDYKLNSMQLKNILTRWIFMSTVTSFYTGSTESEVEKQFADLKKVNTADEFIDYLEDVINTRFTDDFFRYTLPNGLNSSSSISPEWFAYLASLNVLNTPMLFSTTPLSQFFTMGSSGSKSSIDKHHIFPKNYLTSIGFDNDRDRNQIANFTYIDYPTNIEISDDPPVEYVERFKKKLGDEQYKISCRQHALPLGFEKMEYAEFLTQRRILMSETIREAYNKLCTLG